MGIKVRKEAVARDLFNVIESYVPQTIVLNNESVRLAVVDVIMGVAITILLNGVAPPEDGRAVRESFRQESRSVYHSARGRKRGTLDG